MSVCYIQKVGACGPLRVLCSIRSTTPLRVRVRQGKRCWGVSERVVGAYLVTYFARALDGGSTVCYSEFEDEVVSPGRAEGGRSRLSVQQVRLILERELATEVK